MNTPVALCINAKERMETLCPSVSPWEEWTSSTSRGTFVLNDRKETDQVSLVLHIALFWQTAHMENTQRLQHERQKKEAGNTYCNIDKVIT